MSDANTDVIIVGGGFSGSLAATLLDRQGFNVTVVDRYAVYPTEFRAEQLVGDLVGALDRVGVLDRLVAGLPLVSRAIAGRKGKIVGGVETPHYGLSYADMVNRMRAQIPAGVKFVVGKVMSIASVGGKQNVILKDGAVLEAPLVILATGVDTALVQQLGIARQMVSPAHSLSIAFDIDLPKLGHDLVGTYYGTPESRIDYVTVFPFGHAQRANLFMYTAPTDPRAIALQADPAGYLRTVMPGLEETLGEFTVKGRAVKRLNDIWVSEPVVDGVVLVGDAFQTPCPSTGTGISRLVNDVDLLCSRHIPRWFGRGDFKAAEITRFYRDPDKVRVDGKALHDAQYRKAVTIETSFAWQMHRRRLDVTDAIRLKWAKKPTAIGMMGSGSSQSRAPSPWAYRTKALVD